MGVSRALRSSRRHADYSGKRRERLAPPVARGARLKSRCAMTARVIAFPGVVVTEARKPVTSAPCPVCAYPIRSDEFEGLHLYPVPHQLPRGVFLAGVTARGFPRLLDVVERDRRGPPGQHLRGVPAARGAGERAGVN